MAVEDRESGFEKAIARHLRAKSPRAMGAQGSCADAETLAAYHERLLAPAEMNLWKEHISGCSRCQEILAHVEETGAIPLGSEHENAGAPAHHAAASTPVLQLRPRRAKLWFWTAPAGALAAGLLIWVALRETPARLEIAKNQPAPVSLPPKESRTEAETAVKQPATTDKLQQVSPSLPSRSDSARDLYAQELPKRARSMEVAPKPSEPVRKDGARAQALADTGRNVMLEANSGPTVNGEEKKSNVKSDAPVVPAMNETVGVAAQAAPAPAAPSATPSQGSLSKAKAGLGGPAAQAQKKQEVQQIEGMSKFKQGPLIRLANSKSPAIVPTPNANVSWRIGPAGMIERSDDAGTTWTIQTSGVIADLLAGSAISDKVCWVVGKLGTILRTTDGGAHWLKIPPPVEEDFTSVLVVSAQQATVSLAQASYQTLDGGLTWKKLAPE